MFVDLINHFGRDRDICRSARVSYGKNNRVTTLTEDKKLLNFLAIFSHTSPFEMVEYKFYIKAPLFVFNQLVRHRTASVNCKSYRYTKVECIYDFYIPNEFRPQKSKQTSFDEALPNNNKIKQKFIKYTENALIHYHDLLSEGVCKEQARMILPQHVMTEFYWKIDLHNLCHFLKLRLGDNAQKEIRDLAKMLEAFVMKKNPIAYEVLMHNHKEFSEHEVRCLMQKKSKFRKIGSETRTKQLEEFKNEIIQRK